MRSFQLFLTAGQDEDYSVIEHSFLKAQTTPTLSNVATDPLPRMYQRMTLARTHSLSPPLPRWFEFPVIDSTGPSGSGDFEMDPVRKMGPS